MAMPSSDQRDAEVARRLRRSSTFASCIFWKNWKIVKPKLISDSEVRITDISVRSALMRVRWNDMPVRRIDISVRSSDRSVRNIDRSVRCSDSAVRCSDSAGAVRDSPVRCSEYWVDASSEGSPVIVGNRRHGRLRDTRRPGRNVAGDFARHVCLSPSGQRLHGPLVASPAPLHIGYGSQRHPRARSAGWPRARLACRVRHGQSPWRPRDGGSR